MIHVFNYKSEYFIYDSGSGSLHECDRETAEYLKSEYEGGSAPALSEEKIAQIRSEIQELEKEGLLFKD